MPDMAKERTDWAVEIPHLGALILTHSWDGAIKGLKDFPPQDRPQFAGRVLGVPHHGGAGPADGCRRRVGAWLRLRGRLYASPWLHRAVLAMAPSGFIALLAGWTVTEVGRQPFTVYGLLRTADSVSPIGLPGVAASLAAFVVVYSIVFGAGSSSCSA